MQSQIYKQDWSYVKYHKQYPDKGEFDKPIQNVQQKAKQYVLKKAQKNNIKSCIDSIDQFCSQHWMMNLGPQKSIILKDVFNNYNMINKANKLLQLGGYIGYSSLVFSHLLPNTQIFTVQISQPYSNIAKQIHSHAGVSSRNHILLGTVQKLQNQLKQHGPFDIIFIDHAKNLYLSDFLLLEKYGVINKGTLVIGDNIIYPGPKGYLEHFKQRNDYKNVLYHSFVEYSDIKDAVLVSEKN